MKRFLLIFLCLSGALLSSCASTERSTSSSQKDADYHYLMGSSYLKEGESTMALQEFLQAEKLDGDRPQIHAGLAQAYMSKQAFALAEQHYLKALELSGGAPEYHNNLGALYLSMGRNEDAVTAFQSAADNLFFSMPEVAWTGLGFAHFKMNDFAAAESAYRRAIELNPRYVQAFFRLGELLYVQDRPLEAVEAFEQTLKTAPGFIVGHYYLGLAHMKARDTDQARLAFREVIRLAPGSEQAEMAISHLKVLR